MLSGRVLFISEEILSGQGRCFVPATMSMMFVTLYAKRCNESKDTKVPL